jgi:APA family basic amino acid/polyamine antiporter
MSDRARLGLPGAIALVMGGMIGTGVFLLPAALAPFGWNAIIAWLITIGGCLCLAYVISALCRSHKGAIGPAELVELSFGRPAGFLIAFSYWVSCWTTTAALAVGALSYLSAFIPFLGEHPALSALGLIWLLTLVNLASVRLVGGVQLVTMLLKLIPLAVVGGLIALLFANTGTASVQQPAAALSFAAINAATSIALFAVIGFEAACGASHKIADPQRNVARATMIGMALTGLIYLFICTGMMLLMPTAQLAASPAPLALFIATYWAPGPAAVIGIFAAISAIGALNGWTLVQGEMLLELARRDMMPAWFAKTAPNGIGVRCLLISAALASLLVIANSSRSMAALFSFILLLTTSITIWLYLAVALVALKQRVAIPAAIIGLLFGLWALVGTGWDASLLGILLMLAGLPFYWLARREASHRLRPAT